MKILCVEDDPGYRALLEQLCHVWSGDYPGLRCLPVEGHWYEALATIKAERPDIVVLDMDYRDSTAVFKKEVHYGRPVRSWDMMGGLQVVREIARMRNAHPRGYRPEAVFLVSMYARERLGISLEDVAVLGDEDNDNGIWVVPEVRVIPRPGKWTELLDREVRGALCRLVRGLAPCQFRFTGPAIEQGAETLRVAPGLIKVSARRSDGGGKPVPLVLSGLPGYIFLVLAQAGRAYVGTTEIAERVFRLRGAFSAQGRLRKLAEEEKTEGRAFVRESGEQGLESKIFKEFISDPDQVSEWFRANLNRLRSAVRRAVQPKTVIEREVWTGIVDRSKQGGHFALCGQYDEE